MSNRPKATPSHPYGTSTQANGATTKAARVARGKRHSLSPWPRCAVNGKHINKQGFPNTAGKKG